MSYFLFFIVFIYLSNIAQIHKLVSEFGKGRKIGKRVEDEKIADLVREKTGLKIDYILVFDQDKPFGMMPGFPPLKPNMILSKNLYETFTKDELEWAVIHEAGHYLLYHTIKFGITMLFLLTLGTYIIYFFDLDNLLIVFLLSVLLSLIFVQFARILERETDEFAATRMSNPQAMVTATEKLSRAYVFNNLTSLKRLLLGWNILPEERLAISEKEVSKRSLL